MLTNNQEERERESRVANLAGCWLFFFKVWVCTVRYGMGRKEWFRFGACQESRNGLSYGVLRAGTVSANLAD